MGPTANDRSSSAGPGTDQAMQGDAHGDSVPPAAPSGGQPRGPGAAVAPFASHSSASRLRRYLLGAAAAVVLVVAGGGAGAAVALHYGGRTSTVTSSVLPAGKGSAAEPAQQLARVAAAALPSVVSITVTTSSQTGEGSGVILRSDGTIVTNNHVIEAAAGGAGVIKVTFASGWSANAVIIGQDASADISVIRAEGVSGAASATLGSASGLHAGDTVLAIGSPLGLPGSVTSGIVSALHRKISVGSSRSSPYDSLPGQAQPVTGTLENVIQTDTAINPGNSGGALTDGTGRVVGITTAIASVGGGYIGQQSGSIGVGFAIPIETAYRIASQLMKK